MKLSTSNQVFFQTTHQIFNETNFYLKKRKKELPKRKYKSKWHRYGTITGVLLAAIGGVIMILLGVTALVSQTTPFNTVVPTFISIPPEFDFLWSILTIVSGVAVLLVTAHQKPHAEETIVWMILSALLAVLGGTLGGLITFGGVLIYLILFVI